jgi:hypothetical protein
MKLSYGHQLVHLLDQSSISTMYNLNLMGKLRRIERDVPFPEPPTGCRSESPYVGRSWRGARRLQPQQTARPVQPKHHDFIKSTVNSATQAAQPDIVADVAIPSQPSEQKGFFFLM